LRWALPRPGRRLETPGAAKSTGTAAAGARVDKAFQGDLRQGDRREQRQDSEDHFRLDFMHQTIFSLQAICHESA
jgi:hypothetical protein